MLFQTAVAFVAPAFAQPRLLILSGKSNHDWQITTPVLHQLFTRENLFRVDVTNRPDTLGLEDYRLYDLVVGNHNNWPDTSSRPGPGREEAFSRYIREGGGSVTIHAGGSSFYGWTDYRKITIGRWGAKTSHGPAGPAKVQYAQTRHPVTEGLNGFTLTDEIWERTETDASAVVLGNAVKINPDGLPEGPPQPAVMASSFGKGRCFYTSLGHDNAALENPGMQELLLRAAIWASGRDYSISGDFGTLVYRPDRKPYIHPLYSPKGTLLTSGSPADHLWHLGLWFSWKFINGLNYWEYAGNPNLHVSEGQTVIDSVRINSSEGCQADATLYMRYHPKAEPSQTEMHEVRRIRVGKPEPDGSFRIDFDLLFTADRPVLLDRTPIPGETGGQSWGGYSGMSLRLGTGFRDIRYVSETTEGVPFAARHPWVACEFSSGSGLREQAILFDHPGNPRYPSPWYCTNDPSTPMFYFSPAILYLEPLKLAKGESLKLRYTAYFPSGILHPDEIRELFKRIIKY